jgi:hypothetical protein
MAEFTKELPNPVNRDLLLQELIDGTFTNVTMRETTCLIQNVQLSDEAAIDALLLVHNPNEQTSTQQESSFVDAMRPILESWHKGLSTTSQALAAASTVLDNHAAHKSVMNSTVWQSKRLIVNPIANVSLANILGNANAEAAYLEALFAYVTRVKVWRD